MLIGLVLPEDHPWRDEAAGIGNVSFYDGLEDLISAARVPLDVLLVSGDLLSEAPDGVEDLRRYRVARPDIRVVVIHSDDKRPGDPVLAACVSMGTYDLTSEGVPLVTVLDRQATYADAARWHFPMALPTASSAGGTIKRGAAMVPAGVVVEVPTVMDPQFHVIWGPEAGTGRTTVAAGLAALAARRLHLANQGQGKSRVALVDLDTEGTGAATYFGLPPELDGLEPLSRLHVLDGPTTRRFAKSAWNVDLIPVGPFVSQCILNERFDDPASAEALAARVLTAVQREYPIVLVDVPAPFNHPFTSTALANAKEVFFVVTPGRACVRRSMQLLAVAWECGLSRDKFRLVINRSASGGAEPDEIADVLGLRLAVVLPADLAGYQAAEYNGRPYALGLNRAEWRKLADFVVPVREVPVAPGRRTLGPR